MTRKHFKEEDIVGILRQIKLDLAGGSTIELEHFQFILTHSHLQQRSFCIPLV